MRKVILGALMCGIVILLVAATPTIHLFTDFPNAVPVDSDFFVLQRNNSFINATPAQVRGAWFSSPTFTGNGTISGSFSSGGIFAGNGSGLTNLIGVNGGFILSMNGFGTNTSLYGPTTFLGTPGTSPYGKLEVFDAGGNYVAGFDTNKGGFFGFGNLNNFTNFQPSIVTATADTTDPNARRIVAGANITLTDGGAGSTLTVASSIANGGVYTFLQGTTPPTYTTLAYSTNIVGAANFVFGKAYWTNITANFTFPALTEDPAAYETLVVMVTNSGASVFTTTINGVSGAPGHVVPAVFNCTNATVTEIDVSHFGVQWTNACVGKN